MFWVWLFHADGRPWFRKAAIFRGIRFSVGDEITVDDCQFRVVDTDWSGALAERIE